MSVLLHSEDYYGDLDLKTIRKSELLTGIQSNGESRNQPKSQGKPRPTSNGPLRPVQEQ